MGMTNFDKVFNTLNGLREQLDMMKSHRVYATDAMFDNAITTLMDVEKRLAVMAVENSRMQFANDLLTSRLYQLTGVAADSDETVVRETVKHTCIKCGMMCRCITETCSKCNACHLREMRATQIAGDNLSDGGFDSGYW